MIFYYEMEYHLWEFYLLWNMSGIWTTRVNFGCKPTKRFRFWSLKTFDYWKSVFVFFFISFLLGYFDFFFLQFHPPWVYFLSNLISILFIVIFFFFNKFFKLIFFSQSHHSKLNWLGIKFLDWTRFKDFMISMVVGFAG